MRKSILLLTLSVLMLTACGSPAATALPGGGGGGVGAPTPAPATAAQAVSPTIVAREIKADFVATDPGTVQLAAGKPQLVEFFAVW